ncbi:MAG: AAA family ATPase [Ignavibacteria bacterium]|nr:AAA family ATPase [Ignavibacteria bacterium]
MNKIVAVIGMCGSGKSEVVKYFVDKGYQKVYFGDVVLNEIKSKGLDANEVTERKAREELRDRYGMGAMAMKSIDKIREFYMKGNVVIESLYSWKEFKIIKNEFGDRFKLLAVYTTKNLRYNRLKQREVRRLMYDEAMSRDVSEIEHLEKGGPIAFADYLVVNDSTLDDLYKQLEKII